jgi:uncharacterized membrane protein
VLLRIIGLSMIGVLLIIGILSDHYHVLKIQQFLGVKAAFVIPLVFIASYFMFYAHRVRSFLYVLKRLFFSPITAGYAFILTFLAAFFLVYLGRSGNFYMPALSSETALRSLLSNLLMVRPRLKEFLIGYPVLIFTVVYAYDRIPKKWLWIPLTLAAVGPVSLINTFCHLHSPILLSLVRTFNGAVIGIGVGLAAVLIYRITERVWEMVS